MRLKLLTVILMLSAFSAFSQTAKIEGKVTDSKTNKPVSGLKITLSGVVDTLYTNFEGNFTFINLPAGEYTLEVTGLRIKQIEKKIILSEGEIKTTNLLVAEEVIQLLDETKITVVLKPKTNPDRLFGDLKRHESIGSGLTSQQIDQMPSYNVGDLVKKVSGASIQDNKFAIIRGLSDRYNFALINGAPLPSTEADRKAFSFDIFPSSLLDNLIIYKTATPDMPGEFAGGLIVLTTKDIPVKSFYNFTIGTSVNTLTTFKPFYSYTGGKTDWLGIDDGTRAVPKGVAETSVYEQYNRTSLISETKKFNSDFSIHKKNASPNIKLQFTMGQKFKFLNKDWGSVFAIVYNNRTTLKPVTLRDYAGKDLVYNFDDQQFVTNVLASGLWNLSVRLNKRNKLSFKNTYNINSEDQTIIRTGTDYQASTDRKAYAFFFQENKLLSSQLIGEHLLSPSKIKINWVAGYSNINRSVPDFRRLNYNREKGADSLPYQAFFTTNASPNDGGRFYSKLKENVISASYDVSKKYSYLRKDSSEIKTEIKVGGFHQLRKRSFDARVLGYTIANSSKFNSDYYKLPPDQIFQQQYIDTNGFVIRESTNKSDLYTASSDLHAGFVMLDNKFKNVRLVYGVRVENFSLNLNSYNNAPLEVRINNTDLLPSANFTWNVSQKTNLRFAFSKTVSRPEFRELAPFSFFDFSRFIEVVGNKDLQRTKIYNYDAKYETYPRGGQVFSVSLFYKKFINPIEQVLGADIGGGTLSTSFANAKSANNYGVEFEMVKKLNFISSVNFFKDLTFSSNIALIRSRVDVSNVIGAQNRPLQGQSPYLLNGTLSYTDSSGVSFSVSYNRVGKRIAFVGVDVYPDFYEKPRDILDLQLSKTFGKHTEIKFTVSDLLAQPLYFYQNPVGDTNKNYQATDNIMRSYKFGPTYALSFNYKF